jgi:HAD superfamily hydrolase (TIGR01509 family)
MIKAVIFDCYGVLVANEANIAFEAVGGDIIANQSKINTLYRLYDLGHLNYKEQHQQLCKLAGVDYDTWLSALAENRTQNMPLIKYAKSLKLKKSILSNIGRESFEMLSDLVDFSFFDDIVLSSEVGMVKPSPEIFRLAAKRLNMLTEECIFIDDVLQNVEAARAVGMQAMQYKSTAQIKNELKLLLES